MQKYSINFMLKTHTHIMSFGGCSNSKRHMKASQMSDFNSLCLYNYPVSVM